MYISLLIFNSYTHCSNVDRWITKVFYDCKMMTNYCHVLQANWACLRSMQKSKINVCISSTIVIVSLVSYGTHYRTHDGTSKHPGISSLPSVTTHIEKERHETPTSFVCYTNNADILSTRRRNSKIFPAKVSETDLVFLSIDSDVKEILNLDHSPFQTPCFTINEGFSYHCCGYSPFSKENKRRLTLRETNFSYIRRAIPDPYIRIEDLVNGKPEMVDLLIKVSFMTGNQTKTEIGVQHRCRGDVIVDSYPEIHINIDRQTVNGTVTQNEFHWFL